MSHYDDTIDKQIQELQSKYNEQKRRIDFIADNYVMNDPWPEIKTLSKKVEELENREIEVSINYPGMDATPFDHRLKIIENMISGKTTSNGEAFYRIHKRLEQLEREIDQFKVENSSNDFPTVNKLDRQCQLLIGRTDDLIDKIDALDHRLCFIENLLLDFRE